MCVRMTIKTLILHDSTKKSAGLPPCLIGRCCSCFCAWLVLVPLFSCSAFLLRLNQGHPLPPPSTTATTTAAATTTTTTTTTTDHDHDHDHDDDNDYYGYYDYYYDYYDHHRHHHHHFYSYTYAYSYGYSDAYSDSSTPTPLLLYSFLPSSTSTTLVVPVANDIAYSISVAYRYSSQGAHGTDRPVHGSVFVSSSLRLPPSVEVNLPWGNLSPVSFHAAVCCQARGSYIVPGASLCAFCRVVVPT